MTLHSSSPASASSPFHSSPQLFSCPCKASSSTNTNILTISFLFSKRKRRKPTTLFRFNACAKNPNASLNFARNTTKNVLLLRSISNELEAIMDESSPSSSSSSSVGSSSFTGFLGELEDPIVHKLRTQLGVIHPIPSPPINRNIVGLFVFFFFVGVAFDKVWTSRKKQKSKEGQQLGVWPQVPTSFSLFLEQDLQRKESVEWVNMVLGKLWKVYRSGLENWIIGFLQPVIDDLKKPDYVERVEIKQFSLGDEPLSVRNVERRTSRLVNDLQ